MVLNRVQSFFLQNEEIKYKEGIFGCFTLKTVYPENTLNL